LENFKKTSTVAIILATTISLSLGVFVYATFWQDTSSDMFRLYNPSPAIDICRLLLCVSILLTYPFPFFTVRELIILLISESQQASDPSALEPSFLKSNPHGTKWWLLRGEDKQLILKYHVMLTVALWFSTLVLALVSKSMGAVLNLTGCAMGTGTSFRHDYLRHPS
jgi:amino acid permease